MNKPKSKILQKDIIKVVRTRTLIKNAEKEIEESRVALAAAEKHIFDLLVEGAKVEDGKYTAGFEEYQPATRPPWKDLYINHMIGSHGTTRDLVEAQAKADWKEDPRQRLVIGETGRTKLSS